MNTGLKISIKPILKKDCLSYLAKSSLVSDADWCFINRYGKGEPELRLQRLKPIVAVSHLTLSCDNEYLNQSFGSATTR